MLGPLGALTRGQATAVVAAGVLVAAGLLWMPLDLDGDGVANVVEIGQSDPFRADTDGDGLTDGFERRAGTDERLEDTDGDELEDGVEVARGGDPREVDSDGDGLWDGDEPEEDCDGDGVPAIADGDDDGDDLRDGLEVDSLCDPDVDGDGVLDGRELAFRCIHRPDCDDDGLGDGFEAATAYDPLDPDTFDVGLADAIVYAFEEQGHPPSGDEDRDGVPDTWEDSDGILDWGSFDPSPGVPDLLVEYVRVLGPDSDDFEDDLGFEDAYEAVSHMFAAEAGVTVQWTETDVHLDQEVRPGFLGEADQAHFLDVVGEADHSGNPFVTSIVLNPQQTQEDLAGDILGAAFLRSMIATVDYGAHARITFVEDDGDGLTLGGGTITLRPVLESHIVGARPEQIDLLAFNSEGVVDLGEGSGDTVWMVTRQQSDGSTHDFLWEWQREWFATPPNITADDGSWLQLRATQAQVADGTLATTIAHELGHTLGLCHAHNLTCAQEFSPSDFLLRDTSTMSYNAPATAMHFLPSEWQQVQEYLACPPEAPVRLVADGADTTAILDAKYGAAFEQSLAGRACGEYVPYDADLSAGEGIGTYEAPATLQDPPPVPQRGWLLGVYIAAAALGATGAAAWTWRRGGI